LTRGGANWLRVYAGTDTRAAAILLGGALAIWWGDGRLDGMGHRLGSAVGAGSVLALIWSLAAFSSAHASDTGSVAWVVATLAGATLVLSLVVRQTGLVARALSRPTLVYLGSRSYALYLWHYVWLTWFAGFGGLGIVAGLLASLACAEGSWRLVEERALRRRPPATVSPEDEPAATEPVPAAVAATATATATASVSA
jgi:peptidoglycan/LPS O-acetylase OafA/YrhL